MGFSKLIKFFAFFVFAVVVLCYPRPAHAALTGVFSSPDSLLVKVQETVEYFFTFKIENKVSVLEKYAEKRLVSAQAYAEEGKNERVQNMIQHYQQIKEKQNNLLGKINDGEILGMVAERTVEQQKKMEAIKTRVDEGVKQEVIQVQERVVNQVAKQVVDVNGSDDATKFVNEVAHVWAPGTGPGGGESGVVYEGGGKLMYAPGTGPGEGRVVIEGGELKFATGASMDSPGADVKTVEVKTGGGEESNLAPGTTSGDGGTAGGGLAPGTTQDGGNTNPVTNTVDPGGLAPGTSQDGETWLAP